MAPGYWIRSFGALGPSVVQWRTQRKRIEAYKGVETDRSGEQSGATAGRKALEQLVKEMADQRRELQFVVDGLWPAGKEENVAIRREFGIPADKAFKG